MLFLNAALLAGIGAVALPLIIHLLNRSRYRVIPWGAMHLLRRIVLTNRRRLQWEQLILLLLRCAFPVLLALALAQPVLTGLGFLAGDSPGATALLLDTSYSMQAGESFAAAREAARRVLAEQSSGSEAALMFPAGARTRRGDAETRRRGDEAALMFPAGARTPRAEEFTTDLQRLAAGLADVEA
ncbi:MAG: BatA domain-containing protein, partial [Verrucomicrobiota bacterium]|nr:BatA domain-containing protein [Verrucomicrobiota bacterium]